VRAPLTLGQLLPSASEASSDVLLGRFLDYTTSRELELYPAQETAILELFEEKHVILNTPTGSGKSLVAAALHFQALARGRRSVYTCPVKALVNEKWLAWCREFGPENVGLSTGDASVNRDAPILCCTAEILANMALREGGQARIHDVVMDEFHFYADRERGVAWQVPLLALAQARFLLMSATLGDTGFFEEALTRLSGRPAVTVRSRERPVPLEYAYVDTPLALTIERLLAEGKSPIYVVHFTQNEAADSAQDFTSLNVCSRTEKERLAEALAGFKFSSPFGPDLKRWLRHGIGLHHAGLLPKYRVLVEQLAQRGALRLICGTDTLGVGINVPIRTVVFTALCKYDGEKVAILSARDFHQIAGRAGRRGFDAAGWVVVQAPEQAIEKKRLEAKAARDGRSRPKRKAPEHPSVSWDRKTFERLVAAPPERLMSRFQVSHGMLLNVLSRPGDGCRAMRDLVRDSHESPNAKAAHVRRAWQLFRGLIERRIIEFVPRPASGASSLRVNVQLQDDFSMDQTLSLYLLDTLPLLDRDAADYALDVLTLAESILEDPEIILRKQADRLKSQKLAEMKQDGLDYHERLEALEKIEHPKPRADFIYSTFNAFADRHPWVGQENIRPKSIAREMFEQFRSFGDYVKDYALQRSEGLLLRHLSSVEKVLWQTVPDAAKTEAVREIELYLGRMIREVDSSLLDEWEKLRRAPAVRAPEGSAPDRGAAVTEEAPRRPTDVTRNEPAFLGLVRTRIFSFLRGVVIGDLAQALAGLDAIESGEGTAWTEETLRLAVDAHRAEHERILLDPEARHPRYTFPMPSPDRRTLRVQQMLVDPLGHNDWVAEFEVDLAASRAAGDAWLRLLRFGPLV
jgi:superfamily II RNA helicase